MKLKNKHSKLDNIKYEKLEMQPYLKSKSFYQDEARLLFRLRSNMYNVKRNFSSIYENNMKCRLCQTEIEDQQHLIFCENLKTENDPIDHGRYSDIFGNDINKMNKILKIFKKKIENREKIINDILEV